MATLAAPARAADVEPPEDPFTPAEYADAIQKTVADCTVHAELGPARTPLPLALSNFLLDHPDLSAFIVNRRGIAPYRIEMQGPRRSLADDGEGTAGLVNLMERTDTRRLYYGEGIHKSRVFPDIRATAVIIMRLSAAAGPDGLPQTITTFDVYVRMRSRFISRLVKTLRPFLQKTVIGKFSKAFFVADSVGRLMAQDPAAVAAEARAFPTLFVEDRAELLAMIAGLKATAAAAPAVRP
jgi:hypothetical protein